MISTITVSATIGNAICQFTSAARRDLIREFPMNTWRYTRTRPMAVSALVRRNTAMNGTERTLSNSID